MRFPLKILLFVLPILFISSIIALSKWEIPAPSTEVTKSISTDKLFTRTK